MQVRVPHRTGSIDLTNAIPSIEHACLSYFLATSRPCTTVDNCIISPWENKDLDCHEEIAIALQHPLVHVPIKSCFPPVIYFKPPQLILCSKACPSSKWWTIEAHHEFNVASLPLSHSSSSFQPYALPLHSCYIPTAGVRIPAIWIRRTWIEL